MMHFKKILVIIVFFISLFTISACGGKYNIYTFNLDDSFNTINNVTIATQKYRSKGKLNDLYNELNNILIRLDGLFNTHDRDTGTTDLMRINANSGIKPVQVDDEVITVLKKALEMSNISKVEGRALFDPTIAPIWNKWDFVNKTYDTFSDNREDIPTSEEISSLLPLVDYTKVIINENEKTVFLTEVGMELDLGAIVKGYAADQLKSHLLSKGYTKAVIDVGRNILLIGDYFDIENNDIPWNVGLSTPYVNMFYDNYELIKTYGNVKVTDATVVTSGIYEKYIMDEEGFSYHHILDPRTGYPIENSVISVSVVCKESILGDGFSTTLFALGIEEGMKLVDSLDYLETIWVIKNGNTKEVYISEGLNGVFEFNNNVETLGYVYKGVYNANATN